MDSKSIFKCFFVTGAGLLILALVVLPLVVTPLTQWGIDRLIASRPGPGALKVSVRHMGLSGAAMGPIRLGSHALADAVTLDYSLSGLVQGRPGPVRISGLNIKSILTDQGIHFPDVELLFPRDQPLPSSAVQGEGIFPQELLRHFPPRVDVTHSRFAMLFNGRNIDIPFDLSVKVPPEKKDISLDFYLSLLGQPVHGGGIFNSAGGVKHLELTAGDMDFSAFNDLLHAWLPGMNLGEKGDVTITGKGPGSVDIRVSRIRIDGPLPLRLGELVLTLTHGGQISPRESLFPMHGRFSFQLNRDPMPPLLVGGEVMMDREGNWQLTVMDRHPDHAEQFFRYGDMEILLGRGLGFQVTARGKSRAGQIQVQMLARDLLFQNIPLPVSLSRLLVNGTGDFDFSPGGRGLAMDLNTTLGRVEGRSPELQVNFPGVNLGVALRVDRRGNPSLIGAVKAENGSFARLGTATLKVSGIHLNLPFSWPLKTAAPLGAFSGKDISFNGHSLASMGGEIAQTTRGIGVSGMLTFPFFAPAAPPGETVGSVAVNFPHVSFTLNLPLLPPLSSGMELTWQMPGFSITHDMVHKTGLMDPDTVLPLFNATLAARGKVVVGGENQHNRLQVDVSHGTLATTDNSLEVNGINASLVLDDLPLVRSAPGMVVTMDSLRFNKMLLTDAHIRYTIESQTDLLLEKVSFNWCGGEVTTGATRFSSDVDAYHMRLFCHRLRFADLLQQVGSFKAVGEGSLNGQIPVSWVKGDLSFDNGFLYSTPGLGGTIQVTNTEVLTAGIPVNTPQFGQMDLAREALKNYTYKWARVGFNTRGEDLMVKLEFDGSPENILPFEYKKNMGGFVRVDAASPGSRFQGIKLDVNLSLPFNRVMKLGNRLNNLFH